MARRPFLSAFLFLCVTALPHPLHASDRRPATETKLFDADPRKEDFLPFITISPDRRHAGYVHYNRKINRWSAVVDGVSGGDYDLMGVNSIALSTDGAHVAYIARKGNEFFVVSDGKKGPGYDHIGSMDIVKGGQWVAKTVWIADVSAVATGPPQMSQDGKHLAYVTHRLNAKSFVVVDGWSPAGSSIESRT